MYRFSKNSAKHLATCHPDIQLILNELIKVYDFSIVSALRTTEQQQHLFKLGRSTLDGINKKSKHQSSVGVSMAVDIVPYAKGTNANSGKELDNRRFYFMMGIVKGISTNLKKQNKITHDVRFGIDWDRDNVFSDQSFHDLPHFELE